MRQEVPGGGASGGVTHDVSGGEDPVDDGAAEGGDHSETDEDDGRHQLWRENNVWRHPSRHLRVRFIHLYSSRLSFNEGWHPPHAANMTGRDVPARIQRC